MSDCFILLAAGKGKRFKSNTFKQFHILNGKPLINHSIEKAIKSKIFEEIIVVTNSKIKKPVWIAFSVDDFDGSKLRSGEEVEKIDLIIKKFNPDAVLINCSRPEVVASALKIISAFDVKYGAYANGFTKITSGFLKDAPTVDALEERKDLNPESYSKFVMEWVNLGATIVGGCCEVGPDHIKLIAQKLNKSGFNIV